GVHAREMTNNVAATKPNDSRTPGQWITRYITHLLQQNGSDKIDYTVLTHFDTDHIGGISPGMKKSKNGGYVLTGVTEVVEHIPTSKIIDRAWPNYDWPTPQKRHHVLNYIKFVKWQVKNNGV